MSNIINKNYQKEYVEKYNEASEYLKTLLWDLIFLIHGNKFLNNSIPLSTKPVIEKLYNDVKFAFNIRIKSLLDKENNVLKNLENDMISLYVQKSHRDSFVQSLNDLSWNSPETTNALDRFANQKRSVQDAEIILKAAYEYLEKLATDDVTTLSYEKATAKCEWFAGYFFELNDKHSTPISLVL